MAEPVKELPLMEWIERCPTDMREMLLSILLNRMKTSELELRMWRQAVKRLYTLINATPVVLQDEPPADGRYTRCVCCEAGGDLNEKPCVYRTDTGIKEGWYCEDCYKDWKNTP